MRIISGCSFYLHVCLGVCAQRCSETKGGKWICALIIIIVGGTDVLFVDIVFFIMIMIM